MIVVFLVFVFAAVYGGPATDTYKGQFCTDPRTMRKHDAYSEWADAYSCTRHRCQPGGRNLAIYTVGCKRVEAPESAIECEEVVEDTNMQFPFCCTRLRCLVVVRGEVWTRVLGQPWETLPAAPWSHMYKMKKPPPADGTFLPKYIFPEAFKMALVHPIFKNGDRDSVTNYNRLYFRGGSIQIPSKSDKWFWSYTPITEKCYAYLDDIIVAVEDIGEHTMTIDPDQGPIYELAVESENGPGRGEKAMRAGKVTTEAPDYNEALPRGKVPRASLSGPDIVIALSTSSDPKEKETDSLSSHKRIHKEVPRSNNFFEEERDPERERRNREHTDTDGGDMEPDPITPTEKPAAAEASSDERFYGNPNANAYGVTQKASKSQHHPQSWTEIPQNQWNEHDPGIETDSNRENPYNQQDFPSEHKPEPEKPTNLQALVDAIGSRMRDIENVVQRMSAKVHTPGEEDSEKRAQSEDESLNHKQSHKIEGKEFGKTKRPGPDEHYKRFSVRNRGSKYLHSTDSTTEPPLFIEDTNSNGYFSDASNSVLRRSNGPKEPPQTYMAPVETRRKSHTQTDTSSDEKKKKKHQHKKKKGKHHKKYHAKKRFNRLSSTEVDKNVVSLEDSSATGST